MPSITTGSSGPHRQMRASIPYSRRRSTRRTRPRTPVSRAPLVPYSPTPSPASVRKWTPWLKKQVCRDSTREFTIDSTWRRGSPWAVVWPPSRWRRTSTRSPRAPGLGASATAITHTIATADLSGEDQAPQRPLLWGFSLSHRQQTVACLAGSPCLNHPAMIDASRIGGPASAPALSHSHTLKGPKGPAVRRLKWHMSWVQNVGRQFGLYPVRAGGG